MKISDVKAIEILDSRGNPTVRTFIILEDNSVHKSSVPSGASTGSKEALELRDGDKTRYNGKGVLKAIYNVSGPIRDAILGKEADPRKIDRVMLDLDKTQNKSKLGANAILSVSMSVARAAAHSEGVPLWKFLQEYYFGQLSHVKGQMFPRLMVNVINGGLHANWPASNALHSNAGWNFDFQEFMIVPNSNIPSEAVRVASEIFHSLGSLLKDRGLSTLVGDEGGYSPALKTNEEAFDAIISAAKNANYKNVKDFRTAIDSAASAFFKDGKYILKKDAREMTVEELTNYYSGIGQKYKILSFEDPFAEEDYIAHKKFTEMANSFHFTTIGDDLFCTNPDLIKKGIEEKLADGVLVKLNQIGTVSETAEAINLAKQAGWKVTISHRSGETEDNFIADLAYSCAADFFKAGSMSRSERLSKYNRLLEIENGL